MFDLMRRYARKSGLAAAGTVCGMLDSERGGAGQRGDKASWAAPNNKASVQLIASLLGAMLAVIVSTVDYRTLARALAAARCGGLGPGGAHAVFKHAI